MYLVLVVAALFQIVQYGTRDLAKITQGRRRRNHLTWFGKLQLWLMGVEDPRGMFSKMLLLIWWRSGVTSVPG